MTDTFDIIVIGAGHAGCEAASAAARLGSSTLLITMDMAKMAQMSCNPSIGGIAKGQIIREIDSLGGFSGIVTDAATIQFRMLNRSKGPAMWSPRAQCDRMVYSQCWRHILETTCKLSIWQDIVTSISLSESRICSVTTSVGYTFKAKAVILTAGTFLDGKIFIGDVSLKGGRISEQASYGLTQILADSGITTGRMKTGTPPRIDIRSVDLSKLILQYGDEKPEKFSYLNYKTSIQNGAAQKLCYIAHTNSDVHETLRRDFSKSPLFSGKIHGIGPRYCPSIEDKLRTFADKDSHQLFLEPEGWHTSEYYLQGFSSSLPLQTQLNALQKVPGFEKVHIYRPAYAIEYDFFDPTQLDSTLRSRVIPNLYLAGQVNGTTGYEEAAAQGLMAGINAHLAIKGKEPFILGRDTSYIGVLIDDLVTKGVDEPYRMFTSRAEYRILLRQDNADDRLTPLSYKLGLCDEYRYRLWEKKHSLCKDLAAFSDETKLEPEAVNIYLSSINSAALDSRKSVSNLLSRPDVELSELLKFVPRGTVSSLKRRANGHKKHKKDDAMAIYEGLPFRKIKELGKTSLYEEIVESTQIKIKYAGYIERERAMADKIKHLEMLSIPEDFDYSKVKSLSIESRMKLNKHRPRTIAQASRIPGVSPADVSVLLVYFGR